MFGSIFCVNYDTFPLTQRVKEAPDPLASLDLDCRKIVLVSGMLELSTFCLPRHATISFVLS